MTTSINDPVADRAKGTKEAMVKLRISLLGVMVMCLASMFTAAAASAGPFWHANNRKLEQGSIGVKLQNKGPLSLKGTISTVTVTITCGRSTSDATIDGQGPTKQGQGKGVVKYEQCKIEGREGGVCRKPTTIVTNQLKAHLVTVEFQGREQIGEVFEPTGSQQTERRTFVEILFRECGGDLAALENFLVQVRGNVAGVDEPQAEESQEGSLFFPPEPFRVVKHESQEASVGLLLGTSAATFTGYYGVRAQTLTFGVFNT